MSEPKGHWWNSERFEPQVSEEAQKLENDLELLRARQRAKLTVLNLTRRDKEFLREIKVEI